MREISEKRIIETLESTVGKENVFSEREKRYCYSFDATNITEHVQICDAVVFPRTTEQVSKIMQYAFSKEIPVTARGAGTNLVCGCVPAFGGIILDFSKANKILEINTQNLTATVEPGVVVEDLQREVEKIGLFYPPDPSNAKVSTIGGSIALSSGGPHSFKYGTTKDFVLDTEVVCSDGTIIHTGSSCIKNVTGYDLTRLFVGSEGTLGIITKAVLRLIPKPEAKKVLLAYFDKLEDSAEAVKEIVLHHITPSVTDLMDKNTLNTVEKFCPSGLLTNKEAALLIEIDGFKNSLNEQYAKIVEVCKNNNAAHIQTADSEEEEQRIWTARRSAFASMAKLAPDVVTDDFVVPKDKLVTAVRKIKSICEKYNLKVGIMGHIGDGNIHPNIALDLRNKEELAAFKQAREELYDLTVSLGGMLSGEHGIGAEKSCYMHKNISEAALLYMKSIKKLFDPKNILNPGKIF